MTNDPAPVWFVVGPTVCGKTDLSLQLADVLRAQGYNPHIINCDALQLYDALPIATNRITPDAQRGIPHHLLACLPPLCPDALRFRVALFVEAADGIVRRESASDPRAAFVVVGGTMYYAQALLGRTELCSDDEEPVEGPQEVTVGDDGGTAPDSRMVNWEALRSLDARLASRFHPHDTRRVGRYLALLRAGVQVDLEAPPVLRYRRSGVIVLDGSRSWLDDRIARRVEAMREEGLWTELRHFVTTHGKEAIAQAMATASRCPTLLRGIGVRAYVPLLLSCVVADTDEAEWRAADNATVIATRRYARRQSRWISNRLQPRFERVLPPATALTIAVDVAAPSAVRAALEAIVANVCHVGDEHRPQLPLETGLRWWDAHDRSTHGGGRVEVRWCDDCHRHVVDPQRHGASKGHRFAVRRRLRETVESAEKMGKRPRAGEGQATPPANSP